MSDDWQPGDLALCIDDAPSRISVARMDGFWYREGEGSLSRGVVYLVAKAKFFADAEPPLWGVRLVGSKGPWVATRFVKQRPHQPDAEDAETIRLLTGAPVRERVA